MNLQNYAHKTRSETLIVTERVHIPDSKRIWGGKCIDSHKKYQTLLYFEITLNDGFIGIITETKKKRSRGTTSSSWFR